MFFSLRGQPFDSEGGGASLFGNKYSDVEKTENKQKKKKKPKRGGGGGFRMLVQRGAKTRTGFSMGFFFYFCTLPGSVCACAYIL